MFFRSRTLFFLCLSDTRIVSVSRFKEWGWIETQAEFAKKKKKIPLARRHLKHIVLRYCALQQEMNRIYLAKKR